MAVGVVFAVAVRGLTAGNAPTLHATNTADLCSAVGDAYLSGFIYGSIEQRIEWRGTDMTCDGGLRPDNGGVRVVFAGNATTTGDRIVILIGIDGGIDDIATTERVANITVIDESTGRFFSSGGQERCWTAVSDVADEGEMYRLKGEVYCAGSLPAVSGSGSVTLRDIRYSGRLIIDAS